ncbi:MAG: hypothetical protein RL042_1419 [Nitrospirota bacterium]|jgi:hypothetical protein
MKAQETYPLGYGKDAFKARTKLNAGFNSLVTSRQDLHPAPGSNRDSRASFPAHF